jgi:hypothetical protein
LYAALGTEGHGRAPRVWESLPQGGEAMLFEAFMEHAVIWNPLIIAAQNAD